MHSAVYSWLAMTEIQAMLVLSVMSDSRVVEVRLGLKEEASFVQDTVNRKAPLAADCCFQMRNLAIYLAAGHCQSVEVREKPMANSACATLRSEEC